MMMVMWRRFGCLAYQEYTSAKQIITMTVGPGMVHGWLWTDCAARGLLVELVIWCVRKSSGEQQNSTSRAFMHGLHIAVQ